MKSAYLIVAHGNFNLLKKLILQLDHPSNDIFIHIDKKVKSVDYKEYEQLTRHSKVVCLRKRVSVIWGHITQPQATLLLLEAACSAKNYDYYHLLSGIDYPIKSNQYILDFLERNNGKLFIGFQPWDTTIDFKFGLYHYIPQNIQNRYIVMKWVNRIILKIERLFSIKHFKDTKSLSKGCNWWSITDDVARMLVENQKDILKMYKYTSCSDEVFVQTIVASNPNLLHRVYDFDNEYHSCLRCIDWKRGKPYTFKIDDFDMLKASPALFARKFSEEHMDIIDKIERELL